MDAETPQKRTMIRTKTTGRFADRAQAQAAAKKSAEVRHRQRLATKSPQELKDQSITDLLLMRDYLMAMLFALPKGDIRGLDIIARWLDATSRILDRIAGKPAAARPQESGDPDDYRQVLADFQAADAPEGIP